MSAQTVQTAASQTAASRVAGIQRLVRPFVEGAFADVQSDKTFEAYSPVTGERLPDIADANNTDVDHAVASARRSFETGSWSRRTPRERKVVMNQLAESMRAHAEELALLQTVDMGKPVADARWEVNFSAEVMQWFGEAVDHLYGQVAPIGEVGHATITREPVGVVAAITPWNYPLLMPVVKLAPALASGNSVVVKPAEQASRVTLRLAELAVEAGVPAGVLNVVTGSGDTAGHALAMHMDVQALGFTGSTSVGRRILKSAAESNLKKVSLELGGKSPTLVMGDVSSVEQVAFRTAESIFGNAGQMCDSSTRMIVHESLVHDVLDQLRKAAEHWQPGDPFDEATRMGAIVDSRQLSRILGYIELGQQEGAVVVFGGSRVREETGGYYVEPTVLRNATNGMRLAREEIFGPVLSVISFSDEEDAVRIANDTNYGLAAKLWTSDIIKAHSIARQLRAGAVAVNGDELFDITLPHGGYKESGIGRDYSHHAFDNWTQLKTTYINLGR